MREGGDVEAQRRRKASVLGVALMPGRTVRFGSADLLVWTKEGSGAVRLLGDLIGYSSANGGMERLEGRWPMCRWSWNSRARVGDRRQSWVGWKEQRDTSGVAKRSEADEATRDGGLTSGKWTGGFCFACCGDLDVHDCNSRAAA